MFDLDIHFEPEHKYIHLSGTEENIIKSLYHMRKITPGQILKQLVPKYLPHISIKDYVDAYNSSFYCICYL